MVLRAPSRLTGDGSSRRARTRPSSSGTPRRELRGDPRRATTTRSAPAPSRPTGAASSRRAWTDPQALGRRDGALRSDPGGPRRARSSPAPSRPTGGGSSRRADDDTLKLWDAETGAARRPWRGTAAGSMPAPSRPTGGGSSRRATTTPSSSGTPRRARAEATLEGTRQLGQRLRLLPRRAADRLGERQTTLKLWDAETGDCRGDPGGHDGSVNACAFSPDGRRIVSASDDGTLRLWDAETGDCRGDLEEGHSDGQRLRLLPRRASGSSRGARTRPSSSGTPTTVGAARRPSRDMATRSTPAPSRPTGGGSSRQAATRPSGSGTRDSGAAEATLKGHDRLGLGLRLLARRAAHRLGERRQDPQALGRRDRRAARRPSRGTAARSRPAPSRPTGGASSRRAPTRPSSSGTPRPAPARRPSRGTTIWV